VTAAGTPSKPCCYWRYTDLSLVFLGVALCIRKGIARLPVGPLARSQRNIWCLFFVVHTRYGVIRDFARGWCRANGVDKLWARPLAGPGGPVLARLTAGAWCGHNILCCSAQKQKFSGGRRQSRPELVTGQTHSAKSRACGKKSGESRAFGACKAGGASCRHLVIPAWGGPSYPI